MAHLNEFCYSGYNIQDIILLSYSEPCTFTFSVGNRKYQICWNMLVIYDAWQGGETSALFSPVGGQQKQKFYDEGLKYIIVRCCITFYPQFCVVVLESTLLISCWTQLSCGLAQTVHCFWCERLFFSRNLHKSALLLNVIRLADQSLS